MSMLKTMLTMLPQPGEDLHSWARALTNQLQVLLPQLLSSASIDFTSGGGGTSTAPLYQSDGTTLVVTGTGEYKLADGTVVVDAAGLHVYDAVGFQVIDGPTIRIDTAHLVDAAVETAKLALGAVTETKIAENSISTGKLQANSVVAGKIAANAIVAGDAVIANAAIVDAQIANLNASKINAGDIAAARIEANIVTALNGKFATLSALAASLGVVEIQAGGALFTAGVTAYGTGTGIWMGQDAGAYKLRVGNPAGARIDWNGSHITIYNAANQTVFWSGSGIEYGQLVNKTGFASISQITAANISTYIASAAIGTAYIANAAITSAKIGDAQITNAKIADAQITTAKIADANITTAKIADANITNAKIGTAAVTTLKINSQAVTVPAVAITDAFVGLGISNTTLQSAYMDPEGGTVAVYFACSLRYNTNIGTGITVILELVNPAGTVLQQKQFSLSGTSLSAYHDVFLMATQLNLAGTYLARARLLLSTGNETASAEYRSLLLIGCKR